MYQWGMAKPWRVLCLFRQKMPTQTDHNCSLSLCTHARPLRISLQSSRPPYPVIVPHCRRKQQATPTRQSIEVAGVCPHIMPCPYLVIAPQGLVKEQPTQHPPQDFGVPPMPCNPLPPHLVIAPHCKQLPIRSPLHAPHTQRIFICRVFP